MVKKFNCCLLVAPKIIMSLLNNICFGVDLTSFDLPYLLYSICLIRHILYEKRFTTSYLIYFNLFVKVGTGHCRKKTFDCVASEKLCWVNSILSCFLWEACQCYYVSKTSQELRMLSSVTINCQITKIVMISGSQLSEL